MQTVRPGHIVLHSRVMPISLGFWNLLLAIVVLREDLRSLLEAPTEKNDQSNHSTHGNFLGKFPSPKLYCIVACGESTQHILVLIEKSNPYPLFWGKVMDQSCPALGRRSYNQARAYHTWWKADSSFISCRSCIRIMFTSRSYGLFVIYWRGTSWYLEHKLHYIV